MRYDSEAPIPATYLDMVGWAVVTLVCVLLCYVCFKKVRRRWIKVLLIIVLGLIAILSAFSTHSAYLEASGQMIM